MNDSHFRDDILGTGRKKKKKKKPHSPPSTPARREGRTRSGAVKLDAADNVLERRLSEE